MVMSPRDPDNTCPIYKRLTALPSYAKAHSGGQVRVWYIQKWNGEDYDEPVAVLDAIDNFSIDRNTIYKAIQRTTKNSRGEVAVTIDGDRYKAFKRFE